ncbi:hypothetical protein A7U60_g2578 [Sanghuangporus baumii]|uniref:Mediator of RNA polymerase II transcription subunit 19 n=1 Tax=Sanghuangporus baumii TaxID=108892 RepID=A0A9Q5I1Y7_SANBA|nr:hypothetical protein A7U60_g2578 [Sanghuangporus baumii]
MSRVRDFPSLRVLSHRLSCRRPSSRSTSPAFIAVNITVLSAGMDVDKLDRSLVKGEARANAEAGPSSQPKLPVVFLPPPGPPRRKGPVDGTQDLISRFQLLHAYDKYVRPYVHTSGVGEGSSASANSNGRFQSPSHAQSVSTPGVVDKGKGREVPLPVSAISMGAPTPGADGGDGDDGEDEGTKGDKKQKNSYRHLIRGIPGKHSMKKDDHLQSIMLVPPKQHMQISKFDPRTQREAFTVSLEGLKGWNINTLVAESPQAREDRKKRKELKKLAKAQAQAAQAGVPLPGALPVTGASIAPTPGARHPQTPTSAGVAGLGTPRPQGPGPGPPAYTTAPGLVAGTGPPRSATPIPRPGSRAKKRELEVDGLPNGNVNAKRPPPGSAGSTGIPRPSKRPRTDGTMGLPPIPQQQPTPQGV